MTFRVAGEPFEHSAAYSDAATPAARWLIVRRSGTITKRLAFARRGEGEADAVAGFDVADLRGCITRPPRTAHTRTGSPTPFSACSPRSSNGTPADVRASERTVSETSTSPGADSPLMREAMLTAPP